MSCDAGHCITCSDEGVALRVVAVDDVRGLARCAGPDGARQTVEIGLVDPLAPGASVLVHAGVALAVLAAAEEQPA